MGNEVEKYAENGRTRELYRTAQKITNKPRRQVATVNNKRGEIIKDKNADKKHGPSTWRGTSQTNPIEDIEERLDSETTKTSSFEGVQNLE